MDKPYYPCKPIGTVTVLANTLGIHPKKLIQLSNKVDYSYSEYDLPPHPVTGKERRVVEPKYELKKIQKRINSRIFEHVKFPTYLQGGIKASKEDKRDYVENAKRHGRSATLINLDIKNFYPNIKQDQVKDIYKYFFRFSDEVTEVLTKITTYKGKLPQGGCTSSYLANLIFYNNEYRLVSSLRGRGIRYSRLLDDITISSEHPLNKDKAEEIIRNVAAMAKKKGLSLKSSKTKVTHRSELHKDFEVTGLCVRALHPKVRKAERRYIRQLVFECERVSNIDMTSPEYHSLWNKASGLVAQLDRLKHSQATVLRSRLSAILPRYDKYQENKLEKSVRQALKIPLEHHSKIGHIKRYNSLLYRLGILSRTNKALAKKLRTALKSHYYLTPTMKEHWEN